MNNGLRKILGLLPWVNASSIDSSTQSYEDKEDELWQQVYDARAAYYADNIGALPQDILKMDSMTGVWPGGGIFVIQAKELAKDLWVYSSFGLSNPDMPASTEMDDYEVETDEQGRVSHYSGTLQNKEPVQTSGGIAGYGYEMLIIAKENVDWPLGLMQWIINAEILNDTGILDRVEKYNGLTVEEIDVGDDETIAILIAKADCSLPTGVELPNGTMNVLVATVITHDEMQWSMENGRDVLLEKLIDSGVGQVSDRKRISII